MVHGEPFHTEMFSCLFTILADVTIWVLVAVLACCHHPHFPKHSGTMCAPMHELGPFTPHYLSANYQPGRPGPEPNRSFHFPQTSTTDRGHSFLVILDVTLQNKIKIKLDLCFLSSSYLKQLGKVESCIVPVRSLSRPAIKRRKAIPPPDLSYCSLSLTLTDLKGGREKKSNSGRVSWR